MFISSLLKLAKWFKKGFAIRLEIYRYPQVCLIFKPIWHWHCGGIHRYKLFLKFTVAIVMRIHSGELQFEEQNTIMIPMWTITQHAKRGSHKWKFSTIWSVFSSPILGSKLGMKWAKLNHFQKGYKYSQNFKEFPYYIIVPTMMF